MPQSLTVTLGNLIYFEKAQLPQSLTNRLIRLAAFQNPEFYKAQAMRLSVWDKPRVIGNAENYPQHIALPRGCLDAAQELLRDNGIRCELRDERYSGEPQEVTFVGKLRPDQQSAVAEMLSYDAGVLCAPTAFGKTVAAAAMIAKRGVNTLVLVHRTELLKQWQERLQAFLGVGKGTIGTMRSCGLSSIWPKRMRYAPRRRTSIVNWCNSWSGMGNASPWAATWPRQGSGRVALRIQQEMRKSSKFTTRHLDKLIEEVTTDAYNESEQAGGFFIMIEENLALPFVTQVLGQEVTVGKVDITKRDQIVAICSRGKVTQANPILDLRKLTWPEEHWQR